MDFTTWLGNRMDCLRVFLWWLKEKLRNSEQRFPKCPISSWYRCFCCSSRKPRWGRCTGENPGVWLWVTTVGWLLAAAQCAWFPLEDWKHKKKHQLFYCVAILHLYSDTSWMGSNCSKQLRATLILGDRQGYRHISCCPQHGVVKVTFPRCSLLSDTTTTTSERGTVTALFGMVL